MGRLTTAAEAIGEALDEALGKLAQTVNAAALFYLTHF